jgi:hypothetical protein
MEFKTGKIIWEEGWLACGFIKATDVLCQDGKRRNAWPTHDGIADTFFSIPAHVYAKGRRVYGYITSDENDVRFVAYTYRKHHTLVGG